MAACAGGECLFDVLRHSSPACPTKIENECTMTGTVSSLLYVSKSLLPHGGREELERILTAARSRNKALGVSGALIFTGANFAQVLEGPQAAIDELMVSIASDPRHTSLKLVRTDELEERRFGSWSMAYSGTSLYVDHHICPLLADKPEPKTRLASAGALLRMMEEFTAVGGIRSA